MIWVDASNPTKSTAMTSIPEMDLKQGIPPAKDRVYQLQYDYSTVGFEKAQS
jgi:hypothetical protein